MVNIKIEEVDIVSDDNVLNYELLGKYYLQDRLKAKFIKNTEKGSPDYKYYYLNKCYYVEFKSNNDGLRKDQVRWILSHPDVDITIIWVNVVRSKDLDIYSTKTIINNKIPFLQYDKKVMERFNKSNSQFVKELNIIMDCNKRMNKSELIDIMGSKLGKDYSIMMINDLINEGFLFEPNKTDIERL